MMESISGFVIVGDAAFYDGSFFFISPSHSDLGTHLGLKEKPGHTSRFSRILATQQPSKVTILPNSCYAIVRAHFGGYLLPLLTCLLAFIWRVSEVSSVLS